jgi:hypothetical protein
LGDNLAKKKQLHVVEAIKTFAVVTKVLLMLKPPILTFDYTKIVEEFGNYILRFVVRVPHEKTKA